MKPVPFTELSSRAQIGRLRPVAIDFARRFGHRPTSVRIVNHGYNSTFKLETDNGNFALRININSPRTLENLNAEIAWTNHLQNISDISSPPPVSDPNGEFILRSDEPGFDRPLYAVCYHWINARVFPNQPGTELNRSLAKLTARLHSAVPALPPGASVDTMTECLFNAPFRFPGDQAKSHLPIFTEVRDLANSALAKLTKLQAPKLIHYDLHMWNLKRTGQTIHVLDFDDCIFAPPLIDCTVSHFYLRTYAGAIEKEPDYWRALGYLPTDLGLTWFEYEALVASRRLLLANELAIVTEPNLRAMMPKYIEVTSQKLTEFLQTGKFCNLRGNVRT